jgi:hypothetical protein
MQKLQQKSSPPVSFWLVLGLHLSLGSALYYFTEVKPLKIVAPERQVIVLPVEP